MVAYYQDIPIGCGAIKEYSTNTMEIKRMFVELNNCGQGIASIILHELEKWTKEFNYTKCVLETGKKQVEAIQQIINQSIKGFYTLPCLLMCESYKYFLKSCNTLLSKELHFYIQL